MAVKTIRPALNLKFNTNLGPSDSLWQNIGGSDVLLYEYGSDPAVGISIYKNFVLTPPTPATAAATQWEDFACFAEATGTIADGAKPEGVAKLAATASGDGVALTSLVTAFQFTQTTPSLARLVFECRVAFGSVVSGDDDCFIGFCDGPAATATPIQAGGNLLATARNAIGFHRRSSNGNADVSFVFQKGGVGVTYPTNLTDLINNVTGALPVANTFYKLGFIYEPNPQFTKQISLPSTGQTLGALAGPQVTIYVNGFPAAAFLTSVNTGSANWPVATMGPAIATRAQANVPNFQVDWIAAAQRLIQ